MKNVMDVEKIWGETNIAKKKEMLIDAVDNFQYKKKAPLFKEQIQRANTVDRLNNIALNIHMTGEGLTKIK